MAEAGGGMFVPPDTEKPLDTGGATIGANGIPTPRVTPEADDARNAEDQKRQNEDGKHEEQASGDEESGGSETGSESEEKLPELSEEEKKEVKRVERLDKNYDKIVGLKKDADGKYNEKKLQTRYLKKAPLVAKRYETLEKLMEAFERVGLTSGWMESKNIKHGWVKEEEGDEEDDEDEYKDDDPQTGSESKEKLPELSEEEEKEVKRVERLDKNYDKIVGLKKDANGKYNEKKLHTRYLKKAPLVAKRYETLEKLMEAFERVGLTSGWMESKNIKHGWVKEDEEDEEDDEDEDEDDDPQKFREKIYDKVTPAMLKFINGDDSREVIKALDDTNNEIMKWREGHMDTGEMVNLIDPGLAGIIKEGLTFLNLLVVNPLDENAANGFKQADAKFRTLVGQNSYPDTWVLKQPPPIPTTKKTKSQKKSKKAKPVAKPPVETDEESDEEMLTDTETATETATETTTETATGPYAENKANLGKAGYTEEGEKIVAHKFVYFKKGDNKGKLKSGQLCVATGPQAHPHHKLLPKSDFTKKTVDAYLGCDHVTAVTKVDDGEDIEGEFVKIIHTASEYSGPEAMKAPGIIACCERKGRAPIWVIRKNLQEWCESKRGADKMLQTFMIREKEEREAYYAAHGIKVQQQDVDERDRREERRNLRYGKVTPSKTGNRSGIFPYFSPSVSASKTKETETDGESGTDTEARTGGNHTKPKVKQTQQKPNQIPAGQGFDPTSFPSFSAWYEKKHNVKLGEDISELTKVMTAFKTIRDALSL